MKRRNFLSAIAAVLAAPQLLEKAKPAIDVRPVFTYPDGELAHLREARWYIYPVTVPHNGAIAMAESDYIPSWHPTFVEVRSDRPLKTREEVIALARAQHPHLSFGGF